jgi:RNA polymerase sigma factor (sigma-70 family)
MKMNQNYNRYINEVKNSYSPIKEDELRELIRLYKETKNEKAYHKIINTNTKHVIKVANQYRNQGVDIQDLVQAGNLGLHEAIEKFDLDKQTAKFYTYATWWIRAFIFPEINNQSRFLSVSEKEAKNKYTVNKAIQKLEQKLFRSPTMEEISDFTGIPVKKLEQMETLNPQSSLDSVIGHDNSTLKDCIADQSVNDLEDQETSKNILKFLNQTQSNAFNRTVIELRFGIKTGIPRTLNEVGEMMNVSCEYVRLLERNAINYLKVHNQKQKLKGKICLEMA